THRDSTYRAVSLNLFGVATEARPAETAAWIGQGLVAPAPGAPPALVFLAAASDHVVQASPALGGAPLLGGDIDRDGAPGLVLPFAGLADEVLQPSIEAVSGRTGQLLWRYQGQVWSAHIRDPYWSDAHEVHRFRRGPEMLALQAEVLAVGLAWPPPPVCAAPLLELAASGSPDLLRQPGVADSLPDRPALLKQLPALLTEVDAAGSRTLLAGLYRRLVRLDLATGHP